MKSKRPLYCRKRRALLAAGTVLLVVYTVARFRSAITITLKFEENSSQDEKDKLKSVQSDANLTLDDLIASVDLGWARSPPQWLIDLCPEVVAHFNKFPSFSTLLHPSAPYMTTEFAAQAVCTLKITKLLAASVHAKLYIHAGSQLGAILHGQPIPWDDDVDALMSFQYKDDLFALCENGLQVHKHVTVQCSKDWNTIKVWLQPDGMAKQTRNDLQHYSPFVDLFLFNISKTGRLQEIAIAPTHKTLPSFPMERFFPTRPYYFGGIYILGATAQLAQDRYDFNVCKTSPWNHRLEIQPPPLYADKLLNCTTIAKRFPFRDPEALDTVTNGNHSQPLISTESTLFNVTTKTSITQRNEWFQQPSDAGQTLTDGLHGLNRVEVDNTIAAAAQCTTDGGKFRVVEFNAERGKWWLEAASSLDELKQAHVIILNEMDIGMARSDQQHTTRQMAYFLGMNYAWGLEFIELTIGDKGDRENTPEGLPNFDGLHGNAILSRCAIYDAVIYRNQVGDYFSDDKKKLNTHGLEKRLGGRMIMLGRIVVDNVTVVVGSVHKLGENGQDSYGTEITEYIGTSKAVIAGDQHTSFCETVGLKAVVPKDHNGFTWPASCKGFGSMRGDNICTNMEELEPERTAKPCVTEFGLELELGDHALTGVALGVS